MRNEKTILVTEHALVLRLNRAMDKEGLKLKKARSIQTELSVGEETGDAE
jgi:hypothetical protein